MSKFENNRMYGLQDMKFLRKQENIMNMEILGSLDSRRGRAASMPFPGTATPATSFGF